MKLKSMDRVAINAIDPKMLLYAVWVGSDDILVSDGEDLFAMAKEVWDDNPEDAPESRTLFDAILTQTKDVSGNSFEFVLASPEGLVMILVEWPQEVL